MKIAIIGSGVAGLCCAWELYKQQWPQKVILEVFEKAEQIGVQSCSWLAGGMLAPWCEAESAEPMVVELGIESIDWWQQVTRIHKKGSLVLAPQRDIREIRRFAKLTNCHQVLDEQAIAELEPDLAGRFKHGLWFSGEAHLDPRIAIQDLYQRLKDGGITFHFSQSVYSQDLMDYDHIIDCRGYAAKDQLKEIRGVKGEMFILKCKELTLNRAVRLLHPRYPVYIVPRDNGRYMLGATMLENRQGGLVSAKSALELLSSAYALHPILGEAEIVEMAADIRPAFIDNLPRIEQKGKVIYVNGLYRHGFLLSPALARQVKNRVVNNFEEIF